MISITDKPIDSTAVLASVSDPDCGANVLFVGTTRRMTGQRETTRLEYECYESMAVSKMESLVALAHEQWPIAKVSIVHRVGVVEIETASIAVAVSSPHRSASFEAASWLLERLKQEVPVWKREIWADGQEEWVHPETGGLPELPERDPSEASP
jgi:molybdopterin synthase catalytic subunit